MRSNPYVYPSQAFKNPRNKRNTDRFTEPRKVITLKDIQIHLRRIPAPTIHVRGETISDRIFSLFLDDEIRFGPKKYLLDYRSEWKAKFDYFISRKKPLSFTILGFPFKIPVPLKTYRHLPDMGEVLALHRLFYLTQQVKRLYRPGAIMTIFTEGAFGPFAGVSEEACHAYDLSLRRFNRQLGFSHALRMKRLSDMERREDFKPCFLRNLQEIRRRYQKKDKAFMVKYRVAIVPVFRIVKSDHYAENVLLDTYNDLLKDSQLSPDARSARQELRAKAHHAILSYFAYLQTKDDWDFLEVCVPHHLALSVSPKPHRLGIIPVASSLSVLPYHGVTVYDAKKKNWDIEYLVNIRRDKNHCYQRVFLYGDKDLAPFFYERLGLYYC